MNYRHTHYSAYDGSPAMQVGSDPFTLMNEEGYRWQAKPSEWLTYDQWWRRVSKHHESA